MTFTTLQLDRRGSLNLPHDIKKRNKINPVGTPLALLERNGVIILVPLVGDAHQVYAAHGDAGLHQWVVQQTGLPLPLATEGFTPPKKTAVEIKLEAQERRLRLSHELKMQHVAAQAQLIQLRRSTAKEKAFALLDAKAERNQARHELPAPEPASPEQVEQFQKDQAAMLATPELPQATPE